MTRATKGTAIATVLASMFVGGIATSGHACDKGHKPSLADNSCNGKGGCHGKKDPPKAV